ncbi:hypothetical protein PAXRUDRAFT_158224, partial [Paxillus rubicundulus Ve08.2h10]
KGCKEKWKRLRATYMVIYKICNTSGFAYSLEEGADIGMINQHLWDDYVKVSAASFRNQGWPFYQKM